jgi:predicted aspartyl protease
MQFDGSVSSVVARVLLDTGAGGIFISHEFARRAGIAILPSTGYSAATCANNGTPVQIFGMAIVHLNLQSLHCKIRCLVADLGADHDVIIGEPWLREHRAGVSYI